MRGKGISWVLFDERGRVKGGKSSNLLRGCHSSNIMGQFQTYYATFEVGHLLCRFNELPPLITKRGAAFHQICHYHGSILSKLISFYVGLVNCQPYGYSMNCCFDELPL